LRGNERITLDIICVSNPSIIFTEWFAFWVLATNCVVTGALPNVAGLHQIKLFHTGFFNFIRTGDYPNNNVFVVKFSVMCHFYHQVTVPVPAVMVVVLNPPDAALVDPVKPAPIVIV
jgi:hypothetical protein